MEHAKINTVSFDSQTLEKKDEGCENVPPASLLGDTCATPSNLNVVKSRLSGLQSALTPILKYLNIGNKDASSISKNDCSPQPNSNPVLRDDKGGYASSLLNENLPEITLLDVTCNSTMNMTNTQLISAPSTPLSSKELQNPLKSLDVNLNSKLCPPISDFHWLSDEILPEVTLLDDTCDNTINLTRPDHSSIHLNSGTPFCKTGLISLSNSNESYDLDSKKNMTLTPEKGSLTAEMEVPTLETTHDSTAQKRYFDSSEIISTKSSKLEISQSSLDKAAASFNCNLTHSISTSSEICDSKAEDTNNFKLQVTQDIFSSSTLDGSKSSSEDAPQTIDKTDPVSEAQAVNVTHDISARNESVQCEFPQSSRCSTNNVSCELEGEPAKTCGEMQSGISDVMDKQDTPVSLNSTFTTVQDNATSQNLILHNQTMDVLTSNTSLPLSDSQNSQVSTKQINPESSLVLNNSSSHAKSSQSCEMQNQTFDKEPLQKSGQSMSVVQSSCSTSTSLQNTFECKPNGAVMDISEMPDNKITNVSREQITPESSLDLNDGCLDSKSSKNCKMQNQTFDKESLQKSSGSTLVEQSSGTSTSLQNTFESKPNGTITHKETTTMSDNSQDNKNSPPSSPLKNINNTCPLEIPHEKIESTVSDDKQAEPQKCTLNVNVAAEEPSGPRTEEMKDWLKSGHALCDNKTEVRRASTFSLDSTLDFKSDLMVTSTPMSVNKSFNFTEEREEGKTTAVQKKLYGGESIKSIAMASSEIPPNIVCNRKTFLSQPASKSQMLSLKPPSLLSKFKPGTLLPKRPDILTSGQPMTRQTEEPKQDTAQILQQTTEMPIYNLRSTAAAASALKPPISGLRKPTTSGIPSGSQRPGQSLKPPQAKGTSVASSASDKPAAGTQPQVKITITAKKHPLPKSDAAPGAKKKKMDNLLPSRKVDAPALSSDMSTRVLRAHSYGQKTLPSKSIKQESSASADSTAATCQSTCKVRTLKPPAVGLKAPTSKPPCRECVNCMSLEAQLKVKDEEISLLKEEILKLTSLGLSKSQSTGSESA